jgi:hypothetical protein
VAKKPVCSAIHRVAPRREIRCIRPRGQGDHLGADGKKFMRVPPAKEGTATQRRVQVCSGLYGAMLKRVPLRLGPISAIGLRNGRGDGKPGSQSWASTRLSARPNPHGSEK